MDSGHLRQQSQPKALYWRVSEIPKLRILWLEISGQSNKVRTGHDKICPQPSGSFQQCVIVTPVCLQTIKFCEFETAETGNLRKTYPVDDILPAIFRSFFYQGR